MQMPHTLMVVRKIALCAVSVVLAVAAAEAHHSRAAFDTAVEVTIEGVVADVTWANPHVYLTLEIAGANGSSTKQQVEVGPLSTLGPLGLNRDVLVPGERVTVRANPNRRGAGRSQDRGGRKLERRKS